MEERREKHTLKYIYAKALNSNIDSVMYQYNFQCITKSLCPQCPLLQNRDNKRTYFKRSCVIGGHRVFLTHSSFQKKKELKNGQNGWIIDWDYSLKTPQCVKWESPEFPE